MWSGQKENTSLSTPQAVYRNDQKPGNMQQKRYNSLVFFLHFGHSAKFCDTQWLDLGTHKKVSMCSRQEYKH